MYMYIYAGFYQSTIKAGGDFISDYSTHWGSCSQEILILHTASSLVSSELISRSLVLTLSVILVAPEVEGSELERR